MKKTIKELENNLIQNHLKNAVSSERLTPNNMDKTGGISEHYIVYLTAMLVNHINDKQQ